MSEGRSGNDSSADDWRIDRGSKTRPQGVKGFFYWWLESEHNDRRGYVDLAIGVIIFVSIVLILVGVSYRPKQKPPLWVQWGNAVCLGIFVAEYLIRFWANTDYLADVLDHGIAHAIRKKLQWMAQPIPLIDLVAILPFGALRALRTFRFLRLARLLRVLKLARYSSGFSGYVRELKKRSYELTMLALVSIGVILIGAILIFTIEKPFNDQIQTFRDAIWWATVTMTTVGYGDVYPTTTQGRLVAGFLMLTSISIVGAIGGLITSTILQRIETLREGRVERLDLNEHIVFCGWTSSAQKAAQTLADLGVLDSRKLVVLTEREKPDEDYLLTLQGDFTKPDNLRKVNISDAETVVIFHEAAGDGDHTMADRRALVTALQVESIDRDVHTVTEVFDPANFATVKEKIHGDEVLSKEQLDAGLILNAMEHEGRSPQLVYDLSSVDGQSLRTVAPDELWPGDEPPETVRNLEESILERRLPVTFLGYTDANGDMQLNPPGDERLDDAGRLIVVADEEEPWT